MLLSISLFGQGPVTVQTVFYGDDLQGQLSGNTQVCSGDILFTLDLGTPPDGNFLDDIRPLIFVVGDFGVDWMNQTINPLDEFIPSSFFSEESMWQDNAGLHFSFKISQTSWASSIYQRIVSTGGIACRLSYQWKHAIDGWDRQFYSAPLYFDNRKDPFAEMKVNGSLSLHHYGNNSNTAINGLYISTFNSFSCSNSQHSISFLATNANGTPLNGATWQVRNYTNTSPQFSTSLADVANQLGISWAPDDDYQVRFRVYDGNNYDEQIKYVHIRQSISEAEWFQTDGTFKDKFVSTPFGNTHYRYFENTTALGFSNNIQIYVQGNNSSYANNQYLSVHKIDPATWTLIGSPLYNDWVWPQGSFPGLVGVNTFPTFTTLQDTTFYLVTHAVGPQWDADYLLMMVGPYEPVTGDPDGPGFRLSQEEETLVHTPLTIDVFPNPSAGSFQINTSENTDDGAPLEITVLDLKGQRIFSTIKNGTNVSIDLENPVNGLYLLQVKKGQEIVYKKINIHDTF